MNEGKRIGVNGVTPSKTHRFWPICLMNLEKKLIDFLTFSFFLLLGWGTRKKFGGIPPATPCPGADTVYILDIPLYIMILFSLKTACLEIMTKIYGGSSHAWERSLWLPRGPRLPLFG